MYHVTLEQLKANNYGIAPNGTIYAIKGWSYQPRDNYFINTSLELIECIKNFDPNSNVGPKYFKGDWLDPFLQGFKFIKEYPENEIS